jgi:outer membrane lipoprotein-sorting protein
MKKILLSLLAVLVLGAPLCSQTLDEVLAKNYQARGGLEKLKALAGWKLSGKMVVAAQGLDLPVVIWQKTPDRMRVETTFQEKKIVQACDGRKAWWIMPFLSEDAQPMPPEQDRLFRDQAVFENPLVVFGEKGYKLELLGSEEMDGKPVFKLKLVKADGKEIFYYLDAGSGLELKSSLLVKTGESEALIDIIYSDQRPVNGIMMPFVVENRLNGQPQMQMTFEEIEINPAMGDALFAMPDKKEAPGEKEASGKGEAPAKKEAPRKKGRK